MRGGDMENAMKSGSRDTDCFVGAIRCENLESLDADLAMIGIPYKSPYGEDHALVQPAEIGAQPDLSPAEAIRRQSQGWAKRLDHYDFDFEGELFAGRTVRVADCGDLSMKTTEAEENRTRATKAITSILNRGAVPIVIGGDHGTTIPVLRAYEGHGPMCLVHIDAHLDWRDERYGVKEGLSSPMRRASEMPWVETMIQIGLRGVGSARKQEVDDARAYGSILVRAEELHKAGVNDILRRVPRAERYYISFDTDGLDPTIAPAVNYPSPGGLTYFQATNLIRGITRKGRVVGFDFVEMVPGLDMANMTSLLAARLILNFMGALAHEGQIG